MTAIEMLTLPVILRAASTVTGVSEGEILSPRRASGIMRARLVVYLLAREHTLLSFPEIGRALHRDHSSVYSGANAAASRRASDPEFCEMVDAVRLNARALLVAEFERVVPDEKPAVSDERVALLEQIAADLHALFGRLDDLGASVSPKRTAAIAASVGATRTRMEAALNALGYRREASHV